MSRRNKKNTTGSVPSPGSSAKLHVANNDITLKTNTTKSSGKRFFIVTLIVVFVAFLIFPSISELREHFGPFLEECNAMDSSRNMHAVVYEEAGSDWSLRSFPMPKRREDEILIKVQFAALNPVDYKFRKQTEIPSFIRGKVPKIPGGDFAGVVVETSSHSKFKVGDQVFGLMPYVGCSFGSMAQYISVKGKYAVKVPAQSTAQEAASLPLVGLTVIQSFQDIIKLEKRSTFENYSVLIHAGSGGVGSFAIQYAKNVLKFGKVYTTSSNIELCKSLGADYVINYKTESFEKQNITFDVVFDPMGGKIELRSHKVTGKHYLSILNSGWEDDFGKLAVAPMTVLSVVGRKVLNLFRMGPSYHLSAVQPNPTQLLSLTNLVATGKIKPQLDRVYPMSDSMNASLYLESGRAKGKILLEIN